VRTTIDPKLAAVECWTADPCGSVEGRPGTRDYAERLVAARAEYAPWMAPELDYDGSKGLAVLDIGSGQGIDLVGYARAGATATGLDLTPRHVELSRAHLGVLGFEGTVVEGDAEHMPFADESFDRVSSNGVLHHTPDIGAALREARRVLRPDGTARVILYNRRSFHYWLNQVAWRGIREGGLRREGSIGAVLSRGVEYSSVDARPLVRVYTPREARKLMVNAGFADVSTRVRHFRWVDIPYGSVAERSASLRASRVLDALGRAGGWYVLVQGRRP
jgi:ubiquinone/menaquinone biosynthesis C-methylase UbiE